MKRFLRFLKWAGITTAVLVLAFVFLVAPYLLASFITRAGTRPMDRRLTTSPADFDVTYEDVAFDSKDGVPLKGWYLGGGDKGVSLACAHGLFRSRREVLERAIVLRKAGFSILLFDLRRHGDSGGERVTLGYEERLDVLGAVRYLKRRQPSDHIALLGVSMGAAASLLAASEDRSIETVIADSSFLSLDHTVTHHLKLIWGLPRFPLGDELLFFIERKGGFRREALNVEAAVQRIGSRPLLFVAGGDDRRMPVDVQRRLYQASGSSKSQFLVVEGASHGAAFRTDPELYGKTMVAFLESVFTTSAGKGSNQSGF